MTVPDWWEFLWVWRWRWWCSPWLLKMFMGLSMMTVPARRKFQWICQCLWCTTVPGWWEFLWVCRRWQSQAVENFLLGLECFAAVVKNVFWKTSRQKPAKTSQAWQKLDSPGWWYGSLDVNNDSPRLHSSWYVLHMFMNRDHEFVMNSSWTPWVQHMFFICSWTYQE